MKLLILVSLFFLFGCAQLMNGEMQPVIKKGANFFTTCSGTVEEWSTCNSKAKKACSGGYDVIEKSESAVGGRRELTFKCK